MPTFKVDLDQKTYEAIVERAVAERRPIPFQIEVELIRAMGLPFPPPFEKAKQDGRPDA